jgi:hypothetical protein
VDLSQNAVLASPEKPLTEVHGGPIKMEELEKSLDFSSPIA